MTKPLIVCLWTKCLQMVFLQSRRLSNNSKVFNAECDSVNVTLWELMWISQSFTQLTWVSPYSAQQSRHHWVNVTLLNMIHWTCSMLKNTVTLRLAPKVTIKRSKKSGPSGTQQLWPHAHIKITDWNEQTMHWGFEVKFTLPTHTEKLHFGWWNNTVIKYRLRVSWKALSFTLLQTHSVTFQFNPC